MKITLCGNGFSRWTLFKLFNLLSSFKGMTDCISYVLFIRCVMSISVARYILISSNYQLLLWFIISFIWDPLNGSLLLTSGHLLSAVEPPLDDPQVSHDAWNRLDRLPVVQHAAGRSLSREDQQLLQGRICAGLGSKSKAELKTLIW